MGVSRVDIVQSNFFSKLQEFEYGKRKESFVEAKTLRRLFESQVTSRLLDYQARTLKDKDLAYYTISSAGHEGNVVLGNLLRPTDPCLLHYRSGALMMERLLLDPSIDRISETLSSICASSKETVSGGRHKVWGSKKLWVLPQTSTIASHLPKAMGMAFAHERLKRLSLKRVLPDDTIVCCSFGDASVNHSTALGALNTAAWTAYQNLPLPILFVCEDNGMGISVKTPRGWIQRNFSNRESIEYVYADGIDVENAYLQTKKAIDFCRTKRKPVFLHLKTVRLLGHAGSDVESLYRSEQEIQESESQDPLIVSAQLLVESSVMTVSEVYSLYENIAEKVRNQGVHASLEPKLNSAAEIMQPLTLDESVLSKNEPRDFSWTSKRYQVWGSEKALPENSSKNRHMGMLLNWALKDIMIEHSNAIVFGEDVGKKGGVYHVTAGLQQDFGTGRVFNTLLDEQSVLGLAIGAASMGFLPIPEIQYLAYYHNAEDQIRSEAASTSFFSNNQFSNPMVIRIASFAYQKGFGGHFHNDNSIGALRDIPGIIIACPSRGDDAVTMLRTCMDLSRVHRKLVFFLEPIALYMKKDLLKEKDGAWQFPYPKVEERAEFAKARVYGEGEYTIFTYGNGVPMSLAAAHRFEEEFKVKVRVVDVRWLNPLPKKQILSYAKKSKGVLLVDESRETGGGIWESVFSIISEGLDCHMKLKRVVARDTFIPLGPAANAVLPSEEDVYVSLCGFVE